MRRLKKVVDRPKFATTSTSSDLHIDAANRAVMIGRVPAADLADVDDRELLGKVLESSSGHNILDYGVWMDTTFPHVVGVFGTRGTGKSFTLGVMVENFAGHSDKATVVFDVQNQFWTMEYAPDSSLEEDRAHLASLAAWNLKPKPHQDIVQWSPCHEDPLFPRARVFRLESNQLNPNDWLSILDLERYSPMGQALIELLRKSAASDAGELAKALAAGTLPAYQQTTIDGLRWRLDSLHEIGLVGPTGISIDELLVARRTSVFLLRNLPGSLRALVVGVLSRLLESTMSHYHQSLRSARRDHTTLDAPYLPKRLCVVLDEAHVIAPNSGRTSANSALVDYAKRGRDAGLSLVFATQQPSAVDSRLISQADLTITHALNFDADIQAAISRMPSDSSHRYTRPSSQTSMPLASTIRSLAPGEAIVADSSSSRIFIQLTRPRLTAHGGNVPV
ncbi:MAG: ATP-binding protein [Gammaproteobacteria bacterium]|nr:ATP-binding protein [Gammaproteobacteria bacterium]